MPVKTLTKRPFVDLRLKRPRPPRRFPKNGRLPTRPSLVVDLALWALRQDASRATGVNTILSCKFHPEIFAWRSACVDPADKDYTLNHYNPLSRRPARLYVTPGCLVDMKLTGSNETTGMSLNMRALDFFLASAELHDTLERNTNMADHSSRGWYVKFGSDNPTVYAVDSLMRGRIEDMFDYLNIPFPEAVYAPLCSLNPIIYRHNRKLVRQLTFIKNAFEEDGY